MPDHREGRWARELLALQQPDGVWPGWCFHSMAMPGKAPPTTEQALRRLHALGFTAADEPIHRVLATMAACLRGERKIDAYWEQGIDWAIFEPTMLAAWIRRFDPEQPDALAFARRWAHVAEAAFATGSFDERAWADAYEAEFHRRGRHPQPLGLMPFYHAMLLPGVLTPATELALVRHILGRPDGMYYVYPHALRHPPALFASKETSQWLAALETLSPFAAAREELTFAAVWLRMNAGPDGTWDMGAKASDGVHFPLSDNWRSPALRRADCTERIHAFLARIGVEMFT